MRHIGIEGVAVIIMLAGFLAAMTLFLRSVGISYEAMTDDQITAFGRFTKSLGLERLPRWPLLAAAAPGGALVAATTVGEVLAMLRRPETKDAWTRMALPMAMTLLILVMCMTQFPKIHEAAIIAGAYACAGILIYGATQGALAVRRGRRQGRMDRTGAGKETQ